MNINNALTIKILVFMLVGIVFGLFTNYLSSFGIELYVLDNILVVGGELFLSLMQLLSIPIVFVAIVCGVCNLDKFHVVSKEGVKLLRWFIITSVIASLLAIFIASFFHVGSILSWGIADNAGFVGYESTLWQLIGNLIPYNPIQALAQANMLQIVVFSILFGIALNISGEHGKRVAAFFSDLNVVGIRSVAVFMRIVPYGIFCLMAVLFAERGIGPVFGILEYFVAVLFILTLHAIFTYGVILRLFQLSPKIFFKKIYSVILFAFKVSSSSVATPIMADAVEHKLGVRKSSLSWIVPFGSNINKNGTIIMQVVAVIFIANFYHIPISWLGYMVLTLMVVFMSLGTFGAPGFGLITLVMVLRLMGLPLEGMALIIGVDRLIDMVRTSVNVTGNAMVACLIGKTPK